MVAWWSGKSTKSTFTKTSPWDFNLSSIRGKPPIATSPRPSAIGNLHLLTSAPGAKVGEVVGESVGLGVGLTEGVGVGVADAVGVGVGVAFGVTNTPLLQTRFEPLFTQVYLSDLETCVAPSFAHGAPFFGIVAEVAGMNGMSRANMRIVTLARIAKE